MSIMDPTAFNCSNCSAFNSSPPINLTIFEEDCSHQSAGPGALGSPYFQALVTVMYSAIFFVALIGNGAVCFIVRAFPRMRTVTNYFIANLALGDILMSLFCVPFSFVSQLLLNHWPFGGALCRLVNYSQVVSVLVSAYTLVALAADRYRAITNPLRPRLSKPAAKAAIGAVWIGALATALPTPIVSTLVSPTSWYIQCESSWGNDKGSLERLEINNNLLESFTLGNILYLDVSYNRLNKNSIKKKSVVEINYLNLSHNSFNQIKFTDRIHHRDKFSKLDLSFNNISTISTEDMKLLSRSARSTDLRNNPITTIDPINIMEAENEDKYFTVDVRDVPFDCKCSMYNLVEYLKREIKPFNMKIRNSTCSSPPSMKGKLLKDLQVCDVVCDEKECPKTCHCHRRLCDTATLATCYHPEQTPLLFPTEMRKLELTIQNGTFDPRLIDEETFRKVSKLVITNNNLLTLTVQHIPDNIQSLDLRNNSISHIGEDVVNKLIGSSSLKSIHISGNKIVCDCDNQALLTFIQNKLSIVKDVQDEKCFNDKELIRLVSIADLCGYRKAYTIAGITVAVAVFIVITCIALYYKYQTEIKVWLFAKGWFVSWVTEEEIDKDKVYDAFLSWSHKDDEFVLNEILSKLEEGPTPFKICVHYRDWEVGEMINTQINRSIKQSRRTLVVLTPNFLKSPWGMYEFKQAHCHALEESRVRVIVICHGDLGPREKLDPDLQAYLATRTYIEWGDARFWEKLMYALPHPTGKTELDGTVYYRSGMVHFRRRA